MDKAAREAAQRIQILMAQAKASADPDHQKTIGRRIRTLQMFILDRKATEAERARSKRRGQEFKHNVPLPPTQRTSRRKAQTPESKNAHWNWYGHAKTW